MTEALTVALLFGGRSGEHEISLLSARSVLDVLEREAASVVEVGITHDGRWYGGEGALAAFERGDLEGLSPVVLLPEPGRKRFYRLLPEGRIEPWAEFDVVFPVLHGTFGEDGTVQGLLELADVPYVGAGVLASAVAMDKGLFKRLMRAYHIRVPDFIELSAADLHADSEGALSAAEAVGAYPLFAKPANLGSSVGVSKCGRRSDLIEGLMEAAQYDRRVLVEAGIDAREIEVSVLGNEEPEASVPGEVVPSDEFYSYRAKYLDDASELLIPAPMDEHLVEEARRLALEAYKAIDGAGMARVDFLLERETNVLYLNELNTIPGFTRISMYPKLWEASGLPYAQLVDRLIELAFERHAQKAGLLRAYGGAG